MIRTLTGLALASALILSACGESAAEKAQNTVCSARADIKKQVDELKSTTISTASLDGIQANLKAIQKAVEQIASEQGKLSDDRKAEVQKANQAFKSEVADVGRTLVTGLATGGGEEQIKTALDNVAAGYKSAFAPVECE